MIICISPHSGNMNSLQGRIKTKLGLMLLPRKGLFSSWQGRPSPKDQDADPAPCSVWRIYIFLSNFIAYRLYPCLYSTRSCNNACLLVWSSQFSTKKSPCFVQYQTSNKVAIQKKQGERTGHWTWDDGRESGGSLFYPQPTKGSEGPL